MKYKKLTDPIIPELRAAVNDNIEFDVINGVGEIAPEEIFNYYSGKGGLHGLKFTNFNSYYEFSSKKKELELGQFFTDFDTAKYVVDLISPIGTVMDPCCGIGVFCNFLNERDFVGCEIDRNNHIVAKHLFPNASLTNTDVRFFESPKVDYIITNPPFNLVWDIEDNRIRSQSHILREARKWLKSYGVFAAIVPMSYLEDEFTYKADVEFINQNYTWLGQIPTPKGAFTQYQIDIETKIICFQNIESQTRFSPQMNTLGELELALTGAKELKRKNALKSYQSAIKNDDFGYKVKKLIYEIKRQPDTKKNTTKAADLVSKFYTQTQPPGMSPEDWEKHKLKAGTVLYHLRQYANHNKREKSTRAPKSQDPRVTMSFATLGIDTKIDKYLNGFRFKNEHGQFSLDTIQKDDLNKIIQKNYSILNWEQGVGKTIGGYCVAEYRGVITIIAAPSLAVQRTWIPFLKNNGKSFTVIKKLTDFDPKAPRGHYYLISLTTLARSKRLAKGLKRQLRRTSSQLILDESDEISNNTSQVSRGVRIAFSKCNWKLLMTGTTIRNNAAELFPQLQLLYCNSMNLVDNCKCQYQWDKKHNELQEVLNDNFGKPIDALTKFKRCFSPGKQTVFGIEKQEQIVYNEKQLIEILNYTQITRTFKEVCGNRYTIDHVLLQPTPEEHQLQMKILHDFQSMVYQYYDNSTYLKKESGLRILRQMKLLIKSCSVPQLFGEYTGISSTKLAKIRQLVNENDELIMLGTTTKAAAQLYYSALATTGRKLFYIDGVVDFKKRGEIIADFQASTNGILISTQQSLKSSVNIPKCSLVLVESLQWNLPRVSQYYFRAIRYDSPTPTRVVFLTYSPSIEDNLMNLLLNKEQISKVLKFQTKTSKEVFMELGIKEEILEHLIGKKEIKEGKRSKFILDFS